MYFDETMPGKPCYNLFEIFDYERVTMKLVSMVQLVLLCRGTRFLEAETTSGLPHGLPPWWRYQVETFFALPALSVGKSPVTGEYPFTKPVTRSFDVFFDMCLKNGQVYNREVRDLRRHRAHYDVTVMTIGQRIKCENHVLGSLCQGRSVFIMFAFNGALRKINILRLCVVPIRCMSNMICSIISNESQIWFALYVLMWLVYPKGASLVLGPILMI